MPSPFPGMDPWLEDRRVFPNFHDRFLLILTEELNASLPKGYVATINSRIYVDEDPHREPDISVLGKLPKNIPGTSLALEAYARTGLMTIPGEPIADPSKELFVEVVTSDKKRLLTAVEMLSRANKRAGVKQRTAYRKKQGQMLDAEVNFVEIDCLRTGRATTLFPDHLRPPRTEYDYHASIVTFENRCFYSFLPIPLRAMLPSLPIPLDKDMEPLFIPMQPIFERCYKGGRYEELVDYDEPCRPLLTPEHEAWANELLRTRNAG